MVVVPRNLQQGRYCQLKEFSQDQAGRRLTFWQSNSFERACALRNAKDAESAIQFQNDSHQIRVTAYRWQDGWHGKHQHPHDARRVVSLQRVPLQVFPVDREKDLEDQFVVNPDGSDGAVTIGATILASQQEGGDDR